jgi:ribosomal protein L29
MRAFDGQFSDNRPIRRSPQEKKKLIAELKETLANLKPSAAPSLRATLVARIKELEAELASEQPQRR